MEEILIGWVIPILIYSGPFFTFGIIAKLFPTPKRIHLFKICAIVHILSFVPFVILILLGNKDALHSLILPALTGFTMFVSGLIHLIYVYFKVKQKNA